MWDEILEYFNFEQESEYIICFKLKEQFGRVINQSFRYLLIDQENKFIVYSSFSQKERSLVINKNTFDKKETAEIYIREEMIEIIRKNMLYFVFGKIEK